MMNTFYNRIAGHSLERIAALSDGIFAVAMTLLVLDLRTPVAEAIQRFSTPALWTTPGLEKELALLQALGELLPHFLPYLMSFITLGIFWVAQQTQLNHFAESNRNLTWIHLLYLFIVSLMPFTTSLLAEFITYRLAVFIYWLHLLALGIVLFVSWYYATKANLMKEEVTEEIHRATQRRIIIYQIVYAIAMLFCILNTYLSLVLLILMQLNSAIAPRLGRFNRF
jgi:uncharacterized membrane protein